MEEREFYRSHCRHDAPLFHRTWWLDAVCEDHWNVSLLKSGNEITASYLYALKRDALGIHLYMPHLTQFLGPDYMLTSVSVRDRNNEETAILEKLLTQLPDCGSFESRWNYRFQNWLPFHWKKFQQRTRYTYLLPDISDPEKLRDQFSEKIRREISKATRLFNCEAANEPHELLRLIAGNFREKKMKVPFKSETLIRLFRAANENNAGRILMAMDDTGKPAAGIFIAWDNDTAYYIIGAKEAESGNSGAMTFLFWNAFLQLSSNIRSFDFEGSMIQGVENYFRSFGAEQKGFFEITKIDSPVLKVKSGLKSLLGK